LLWSPAAAVGLNALAEGGFLVGDLDVHARVCLDWAQLSEVRGRWPDRDCIHHKFDRRQATMVERVEPVAYADEGVPKLLRQSHSPGLPGAKRLQYFHGTFADRRLGATLGSNAIGRRVKERRFPSRRLLE